MSPDGPLRCPRCRKVAVEAHAPFCSAACRDRDLLDWLEERYVIPGPPLEDSDAGPDGAAPPQ
ncbi:DNA gyrase inhibitor YacG [Thermaurantiacus tibetensis]|uniref:DNA gyrase inhibitor YacG n=1 Tax=Thermaurantiacus tibetensis TaxID=2759035 RepID=UPI00188EFA36|nr:DNA gyrase inhibitor YacG [Thermaurantiacus tibetensis]